MHIRFTFLSVIIPRILDAFLTIAQVFFVTSHSNDHRPWDDILLVITRTIHPNYDHLPAQLLASLVAAVSKASYIFHESGQEYISVEKRAIGGRLNWIHLFIYIVLMTPVKSHITHSSHPLF